MMETLRKAGKTWVAKLLLVILVGSFGIWGIHSSIFSASNDAVVTVGSQKISNSEFMMSFNSIMNDLSNRIGRRITLEEAKIFDIEGKVNRQLVASGALDQIASDMKLGLSQDQLLSLIQQEPAFQNQAGAFDRNRMAEVLNNMRVRQEDYLAIVSHRALRSQVIDALTNGFEPPKLMVDSLTTYMTEARSIKYLILTRANISPVKVPADDVLAKWYATNISKYRAPEYRKVSYVKLEPTNIADAAAVAESAVKDDYEKHKSSYVTPATRTIEQLTYADKASADAARAKLASGTSFDQLVSDQGKTATDVLLGDFTKDKMPTPTMADAAFAVKANGDTTPVVQGLLGPVIMRVTNIRPEGTKTYDEVKGQIRKDLAISQANDDIPNIYNRFEDVRASGAPLADAAKQLQLKLVTIDAVDSQGLDPSGKPVASLPKGVALLPGAFKTDVGVDPDTIQLDNGGYVWFETDSITPSRDRKLDEVKDKVIKDWTAEQENMELVKKAGEIAGQIRKGSKIEDIATGLKIAVETKAGIHRGMTDAILGPGAIEATFGGPNGYVSSAPGTDPTTEILLQVTDVQDQGATDALDTSAQQVKGLTDATADDILNQLADQLQAQYGATTNKTLANQLMIQQ